MDKNEKRVEKLRELVDKAGGNASFARKYSRKDLEKQIDASYISQVLNGHRAFGEKAAKNMEDISTIPVGYFDSESNIKHVDIEDRSAPKITWVQAWDWRSIMNSFNKGEGEYMALYSAGKGCGRNTFVLEIENESMCNPDMPLSFKKGDIIYIDPDAKFKSEAFALIKIKSKKETFFRQVLTENKTRYLKALNKDWPDRITKMTDDHEIIGLLRQVYIDASIYNK